MFHFPVEHVGYGLDAAVRVPWKALQVMRRVVGMKVVEEQERVQKRRLVVPEGALQVHARPLYGRLTLPDLPYLAQGLHNYSFGDGLSCPGCQRGYRLRLQQLQ